MSADELVPKHDGINLAVTYPTSIRAWWLLRDNFPLCRTGHVFLMGKFSRECEYFRYVLHFFIFVFVVPLFLGIQLKNRARFDPLLKHDRLNLLDFLEFRLILILQTIPLDLQIQSLVFLFKVF